MLETSHIEVCSSKCNSYRPKSYCRICPKVFPTWFGNSLGSCKPNWLSECTTSKCKVALECEPKVSLKVPPPMYMKSASQSVPQSGPKSVTAPIKLQSAPQSVYKHASLKHRLFFQSVTIQASLHKYVSSPHQTLTTSVFSNISQLLSHLGVAKCNPVRAMSKLPSSSQKP